MYTYTAIQKPRITSRTKIVAAVQTMHVNTSTWLKKNAVDLSMHRKNSNHENKQIKPTSTKFKFVLAFRTLNDVLFPLTTGIQFLPFGKWMGIHEPSKISTRNALVLFLPHPSTINARRNIAQRTGHTFQSRSFFIFWTDFVTTCTSWTPAKVWIFV